LHIAYPIWLTVLHRAAVWTTVCSAVATSVICKGQGNWQQNSQMLYIDREYQRVHRRRLLEMTVGARFPSPSPPFNCRPVLSPLPSHPRSPPVSPFIPSPSPPVSFTPPLPCPYPTGQIQVGSLGERPGGARPPNAFGAFSGWNQRTFFTFIM